MIKTYGVHDHWTDIAKKNDVDIMSVDGVITGIKVNGEDYGGSSDFSTAEMTLISAQEYVDASFPLIIDDGIEFRTMSVEVGTYTVPLYKNRAIFNAPPSYSVSLSGDVVFDDEFLRYIISGDCSITLNPKKP